MTPDGGWVIKGTGLGFHWEWSILRTQGTFIKNMFLMPWAYLKSILSKRKLSHTAGLFLVCIWFKRDSCSGLTDTNYEIELVGPARATALSRICPFCVYNTLRLSSLLAFSAVSPLVSPLCVSLYVLFSLWMYKYNTALVDFRASPLPRACSVYLTSLFRCWKGVCISEKCSGRGCGGGFAHSANWTNVGEIRRLRIFIIHNLQRFLSPFFYMINYFMQSETSCCYKSAAATLQRLYSLNGDIAVVLAKTGKDTFNVDELKSALLQNEALSHWFHGFQWLIK